MTPSQERGFKVGDLVRYAKHHNEDDRENIGEMFILEEDDGTRAPYLRSVRTGMRSCYYIDSFNKATELALKKYEEKKLASAIEMQRSRFTDDIYKALPDNVSQAIEEAGITLPELHFVHISEKHPGLIAYTPDGDLIRDRQVPTKIGKYLTVIAPDVAQPKIAHIANMFNLYCKEELFFFDIARTAEAIREVYLKGPRSCMAKPSEYFSCGDHHPTEVYATEDVGVAYIKDKEDDRVIARVVLNMVDKTYYKIYGNEEALSSALKMAGYEGGDGLSGCRLQKIPYGKGFVMPYLDGEQWVEDAGDYFVVNEQGGDFHASEESGIVGGRGVYCEVCEEYHDEEDSHYSDWHGVRICESCIEGFRYAYTGRSAQDWIDEDESGLYEYNGEYYMEDALADHDLGLDSDNYVHPADELVETEDGETWHVDDCVAYEDKKGNSCYIHDNHSDELERDFFSDVMIWRDDANVAIDPQTDCEVYSYSEFELAQA